MKIKPFGEIMSFRNKYLALTIISLLFFATSQAQWLKPNNSYGTISNGQSIERVLFFPTGCGTPNKLNIPDSAVNKFAIYGDSCGNVAYLYNPRTKIWSPISNGSGIIQDGLISGGIVTWSGSGLKFYISPAIYVIGGKFYNSPFDSVTLATAPTSDSRIDLIGVDTTGHAFATTGTPSITPIVPQADVSSQIALTTGILLNAGDTIPSNVTTDIVYSEGVKPPDWDTLTQGTPMVVNFTNTTNPYAGSKDVYVSKYSQGSTLKFVSPSLYPVTTDATLSFWIYLNGKFTNQVYAQLYDASASASAWLRITPYFNINDSGKYQLVTVPVSAFAWTNYSGNFDRVLFNLTGYDTSGVKGFYLDNIQFQKGINSIPPQTDYSNKLDSILLSNDSLFQYVKGVKTFKGLASGSGGIGGGITKLGDSPYGLIKLNDSTYLVDSTLLLTKLMAAATYLNIVDTTDKWIPVGSKFPIGVIKPILALNDSTLAFDSLNLTEIRYSQAARDTATWTDTTLIDKRYFLDRLASYSPGGGSYHLPYNGTSTDYLGGDTVYHPLPTIPSQFNPIAGTGISISGTYPNITFNSTGGSGGLDSTAIHPAGITVPAGDSTLKFEDLKGNSTVVSFALLQFWKKIGSDIYFPGGSVGNVNIGLGTKPVSTLSIIGDYANTTLPTGTDLLNPANDVVGFTLKDSADAIVGYYRPSPALVLWGKSWNTTHSASENVRFKMQVTASSSASTFGSLNWYASLNDGTYTNPMSLQNNGNLAIGGQLTAGGPVVGTNINGAYATFSRSVNNGTSISSTDNIVDLTSLGTWRGLYINPTISANGSLGVYKKAIETTIGDVALNTTSGNTIIGKDTADNANKLSVVSTNSFFGLPAMTSAQRDSVYTTFTGTLAGGSGYTSNTFNTKLTGGSGTGAEARLVITGGVVTSFTLTKVGKRYAVGDVLTQSTSIGSGTGFSYTITSLTPPRAGSTVYCTDCTATDSSTGVSQTWTGTTWKNWW